MTRSVNRLVACAALGVAFTSALAAPARAQDRGEVAADDGELGSHQKHVRLDAGLRSQFIASDGLDPFSQSDYVPQLALGASYTLWTSDRLSVAGALGFDYGASSADARSSETELSLMRFTLAPELRYHVLRVLALTGKLGPTVTRQEAQVSTGLATELEDESWKVGFDATVGAALEVYGYSSGKSRRPRIWLTAEGGYGFAAANEMRLFAKESNLAPQRSAPLTLPDLSASGPLFKLGAALSF